VLAFKDGIISKQTLKNSVSTEYPIESIFGAATTGTSGAYGDQTRSSRPRMREMKTFLFRMKDKLFVLAI
jgi:hypothetical protein